MRGVDDRGFFNIFVFIFKDYDFSGLCEKNLYNRMYLILMNKSMLPSLMADVLL